jgi:hypothetical protein
MNRTAPVDLIWRRVGSSAVAGAIFTAFFLRMDQTNAATTFSVGAGSSVTSVDRSANFNSIVTGTDLSNYSEGGLSITTPNFAFEGFDPFNHTGDGSAFSYPNGGVNAWVTIKTTDARPIYAAEFLYGNGYVSDVPVIYWETIKSSVVVSSGSIVLSRGAILGFSDPNGFDQLLVSASEFGSPTSVNAIALDNLKVQLAPVPEASTFLAGALLAIPFGLRVLKHLRTRKLAA